MTTDSTPRGVISQKAAVTTVAAVFACGLLLDAATKVLAVHRLDPNDPPTILGGLLTLQLIRNPGAAFSIGESYTWIFAILATAALLAIVLLLVPRIRHRGWSVAVGLIMAGIGGNLIDRVARPPAPFRGHVIDFLQLPAVGGYQWPIFNIADICVTSGAVLVAAMAIIWRVDWDGLTDAQRRAQSQPADEASDEREESAEPQGAEVPQDALAHEGAERIDEGGAAGDAEQDTVEQNTVEQDQGTATT